jgi:hypothetical protein
MKNSLMRIAVADITKNKESFECQSQVMVPEDGFFEFQLIQKKNYCCWNIHGYGHDREMIQTTSQMTCQCYNISQ